MPKKNKRKHKQTATDFPFTEVSVPIADIPREEKFMDEKLPTDPAPPNHPPPLEHDRPAPNPTTLASLREDALRARRNVTEQIASLESWAAEIQATIEFLKASKR